jgi:hypothetical protein
MAALRSPAAPRAAVQGANKGRIPIFRTIWRRMSCTFPVRLLRSLLLRPAANGKVNAPNLADSHLLQLLAEPHNSVTLDMQGSWFGAPNSKPRVPEEGSFSDHKSMPADLP